MIDKCQWLSLLRSIALAWLAVGSCGCSEELGPERMIVTPVKGFVREGRSAVTAGWIEFLPVEGTVGNLRSAKIGKDGSFEAEHVAVGVNLIRLANAPLGSQNAERLFGSYQSPIRRTVLPQPTEPIVIDVFEEAIRFKNSQALLTGPERGASGDSR
jgi:hypothetical protein